MKRIPQVFTGTGDLFAALLLAYFKPSSGPDALCQACDKVVSTMQSVLERTLEYRKYKSIEDIKVGDPAIAKSMLMADVELKLVQSRDLILQPNVVSRSCVIP